MEENEEPESVHIGPAQTPWWKFKLAGHVWKLTRGNPISSVGYITGVILVANETFVFSKFGEI